MATEAGTGAPDPGRADRERRFLEQAARVARIGSWYLEMATGVIYWSDEMHHIVGTEPGTFVPTVTSFVERVHPDDTGDVAGRIERFLNGEGQEFGVQHRMVHRDGRIVRVETAGERQVDEHGATTAILGYTVDVTARRHTEDELADAQMIAGVGSWTADLVHPTIRWSDQLKRIFGLDVGLVLPEELEYLHRVHPEDRARVSARVMEAIASREPYRMRHRILRADGSVRWVQVMGRVDYASDGTPLQFTGTAMDVTEELTRRRELTEAHERFEQLLGAATHQAIIGTDLEGRVRIFNRGAERMLGYRAEEILGQPWMVYHDPYEVGAWLEAAADGRTLDIDGAPVEEGGVMLTAHDEREWTWVRADGTRFPVLISTSPMLDQDGRTTGYVGIAADVTEQRQAEAARRRAVEAMAEARDRAELANKAKSAFLATMSHEIRTPMNAVLGLSGLLLDTDLDEQQRDLLTTLRSSGDQLLAIINDILDFSKVEAGELDLEQRPFDPRALTREVVTAFAATATDLELDATVAPDVPGHVVGDAVRVRQVLGNLVSNAVKFTHEGGVQVLVRAPGGELRVDVTDTGIGIPEDAREKLFRSFSQVDASTTRVYGGTGLGLAICRSLVEAMGGWLWVKSAVGVGSTFSFTMPLVAAEAPDAVATVPAPRTTTGADGAPRRLRVLLAEDNTVNQKVGTLMLTKLGHDVEVAANGREALDAVVARDFDVVLMDMHMPEMDGLEATRRIRGQVPPGRQPWVVAVTASVTQADRDACTDAGMDAYVPKPIRLDDLAAALTQVPPAGREGRNALV